jgi:hypothetical protein
LGDDETSANLFTNWFAVDPLIDKLPLDYGRFVDAVNSYNIGELGNNSSYVSVQKMPRFTFSMGLVFDIPFSINRFKHGKK